jgi:hypothetical protein
MHLQMHYKPMKGKSEGCSDIRATALKWISALLWCRPALNVQMRSVSHPKSRSKIKHLNTTENPRPICGERAAQGHTEGGVS